MPRECLILRDCYLCGNFQTELRMPLLRIKFAPFYIFLLMSTTSLSAQGEGTSGSLYVTALLIIVGALVLVAALLTLSENFIQIESSKAGVTTGSRNFKSLKSLWAPKPPAYTEGHNFFNLEKGYDILLKGEAPAATSQGKATRFAVRPIDYRGLAPIPKVTVEVGEEVKAGDVLFHDKKDPTVKYVAPVSGELVEVRRGQKRAINDIIILADKEMKYKQFDPPSIAEASREDIIAFLCESGGWTLLNQRPYDMLPNRDVIPTNIFISTFDTAPLAPDLNYVVNGKEMSFQKGLDTLARLTDGSVHLGLDGRQGHAPHAAFKDAKGVQKHYFAGKHPAGNVGVQIHHIAPINAGEVVWTLGVQEVITLGDLMYKGIWNAQRTVAITGGEIKEPSYVNTYLGANIGELISGNVNTEKVRLIDGDVLSGKQVATDDFLSNRTDQLTAIAEGDYFEMFGWLLPLAPRPTISNTFPNFLYKNMKFEGDTNTHGEKRAFVVTGQYEKVMPMDIHTQHLMKSILTGDFEKMEGYGIYELSEEDVALAEFVCTSKQPLQSILRDGLDMMLEQG